MVNFYENQLNKKAKIRNIKYRELEKTQACLKKSKKKLNYQPAIGTFEGLKKFYDWYMSFRKNEQNL